jgi:uncharacterized membrane protein
MFENCKMAEQKKFHSHIHPSKNGAVSSALVFYYIRHRTQQNTVFVVGHELVKVHKCYDKWLATGIEVRKVADCQFRLQKNKKQISKMLTDM